MLKFWQNLEISDLSFSGCYGEMEFDPEKFKNAKSMVKQLSEMGIPLTVCSKVEL